MKPESKHPPVDSTTIDTFDQDRNAVLHLIGPLIRATDHDVDAAFTDDTIEDRLRRVKEVVQPQPRAAAPRASSRRLREASWMVSLAITNTGGIT